MMSKSLYLVRVRTRLDGAPAERQHRVTVVDGGGVAVVAGVAQRAVGSPDGLHRRWVGREKLATRGAGYVGKDGDPVVLGDCVEVVHGVVVTVPAHLFCLPLVKTL